MSRLAVPYDYMIACIVLATWYAVLTVLTT